MYAAVFQEASHMTALSVGSKAPDFKLKDTKGVEVTLGDLLKASKAIILAFYPAAWSSVCGSEMTLYQEVRDEFRQMGADIVGISEDNVHSIDAWAQQIGIGFPLLSDFSPKGVVATQYGVLRDDGTAERALFIVSADGTIRYSYVSPIRENPGADRLFDALEKMHAGAVK
jgi:peroxiredoxin